MINPLLFRKLDSMLLRFNRIIKKKMYLSKKEISLLLRLKNLSPIGKDSWFPRLKSWNLRLLEVKRFSKKEPRRKFIIWFFRVAKDKPLFHKLFQRITLYSRSWMKPKEVGKKLRWGFFNDTATTEIYTKSCRWCNSRCNN